MPKSHRVKATFAIALGLFWKGKMSEEELARKWDKCIANTLLKVATGCRVGNPNMGDAGFDVVLMLLTK